MQQPKLSELADTLIGSEIVKLGNQIKERIRLGEKIYNFTIGDFDPKIFPIPAELEFEIIAAYKQKYTSYPAAEGELELRTAIAQYLKHWQGLDYNEVEIQVASGGRPLMYSIFQVVVDPGDKVVYAVPSWNNNHYTHLTGGDHCVINATPENNFMPWADDIAPHLKRAALICLCSPQNPTGTTLQVKELKKICELIIQENNSRGAGEKKLYLMYDQMYGMLTYGGLKHVDPVALIPEMKAYTIFVDGISKAFCSTGLRVGWSMGPAHVIAKMKAVLSHLGAWAPMAEQKATAKYLRMTPEIESFLLRYKQEIELRLKRIFEGFMQLKSAGHAVDAISPQAAIYLTIKLDLAGKQLPDGSVLTNQGAVTQYLLEKANIALVPFNCFGSPHSSPWYRLSVGTCKLEDIEPMLNKLKEALTVLK